VPETSSTTRRDASLERGRRVADVLGGSWRESAVPLDVDWLPEVEPLLTGTGAAGLAWRRLEGGTLASAETGTALRSAYLRQRLFARLAERELVRTMSLLRSRGIEPLLVKGWALARQYPAPGLRPSGDIDLCVPPQQHEAALRALAEDPPALVPVEINPGYPKLLDRTSDDLYAHSGVVYLDGTPVRIPAPEEHLRLLCLHLLAHGAWRPIWLCDVAVVLENRGPRFDWDRCLRGHPVYSGWVACTIGLAGQLLGAEIEGTPASGRSARLPRWLAPAVLRQWAAGPGTSSRGNVLPALRRCWREPALLAEELRSRWRNPIQASVELHAPFNDLPRLPLQLAATFGRLPSVARQFNPPAPSRR
jgi:hypothetical protein